MVSSNKGFPEPENPPEDLNHEIIMVTDTDTDEEENSYNDYEPLPTNEDNLHEYCEEEQDSDNEDGLVSEEPFAPITSMEDTLIREVWSESTPKDIIMDKNKVDEVKQAMLNFSLPASSIPDWASHIPEAQWKEKLMDKLHNLQKK